MKICPYCGSSNPDTVKHCPSCGADLTESHQEAPRPEPTPVSPAPAQQQQQSSYRQDYYQPQVTPYSTGGLMAWSIITILLCTIPGVVALINTLGINKCTTVEEQQKKISAAKTWCTVGTVIGILYLILSMVGAMSGAR